MVRMFLLLALVVLTTPEHAWSFVCKYPTQRLTGFAGFDNSEFIKLDLTVRLLGPECQPELAGGHIRCRTVGPRTLGVRFTAPARGKCPGPGGRVVDLSYVPRSNLAEPTLADVSITGRMGNGVTCTISGVTARFNSGGAFSGPFPLLIGHLTCEGGSDSTPEGTVELLRLPLPSSSN